MGLIVTYCRHIRRYIRVTSNIPGICRGFSFAVKMETIRPVHLPWTEISNDNDVKWAPDGTDKYDSSGGGGAAGPSSAMLV